MESPVYILGIESSCDETAAAVSRGPKILANVIAGQQVHEKYGGVVPELASRAHQKNIVPVVDQALKDAKVTKNDLQAIAFTNGPGLMGSLLVGVSFAKAMALALEIPLIEVNHMHAHVLAHFIDREQSVPQFPFLCLTVSGGHTQIIKVTDYLEMEILGQTTDDAAGEAFDKAAKILGLPYPGGPLIDKYAKRGVAAFNFPHPKAAGLNFSFSGLKTAFLYFVRDNVIKNENFINDNLHDLCASLQKTIVQILINKIEEAMAATSITEIAIAGGVSANSGLREALTVMQKKNKWKIYIPPLEYCTDNAAMIAVAGFYKFRKGIFADQSVAPFARYNF